MSDTKKIITIYATVIVVSALIMFIAFAIRGKNHELAEIKDTPQYQKEANFEAVLQLEEDFLFTNQDGEEVRISDLKGKVWAFAQFYAFCPMCAERNDQGLKALYEKFKADPDFMVVCVTVDPENDSTKQLKTYANALDADTSDWLFLTGDPEPMKRYMIDVIKYQTIVKRENPEEAARLGTYEHDMSIAIFNRDLGMVKRHDLFNAKAKGDAFYTGEENKLHFTVETLLKTQ